MSDLLFLSRGDVASLLDLDDSIAAVERAFAMLGRGELPPPAIAGVHAAGGAFHIKAAIAGGRFAAKINANFFDAVPRIKGVLVPVLLESTAQLRLLGGSTLRMTYRYSEIDDRPIAE